MPEARASRAVEPGVPLDLLGVIPARELDGLLGGLSLSRLRLLAAHLLLEVDRGVAVTLREGKGLGQRIFLRGSRVVGRRDGYGELKLLVLRELGATLGSIALSLSFRTLGFLIDRSRERHSELKLLVLRELGATLGSIALALRDGSIALALGDGCLELLLGLLLELGATLGSIALALRDGCLELALGFLLVEAILGKLQSVVQLRGGRGGSGGSHLSESHGEREIIQLRLGHPGEGHRCGRGGEGGGPSSEVARKAVRPNEQSSLGEY